MKVENLAYPWMKDFRSLLERIEFLETRIHYLEGLVPNQKPQPQTVTTNTAGAYIPNQGAAGGTSGQIWTGGAGGISGQAWGGSSSGTRIKK